MKVSGGNDWKLKSKGLQNENFFNKLERFSQTLRSLARDMVDFLIQFESKNTEINELIIAYNSFITTDIKEIDVAIDRIKDILLKINVDHIKKNKPTFKIEDWDVFIKKQSDFNNNLNQLLEYALKNKKLYH